MAGDKVHSLVTVTAINDFLADAGNVADKDELREKVVALVSSIKTSNGEVLKLENLGSILGEGFLSYISEDEMDYGLESQFIPVKSVFQALKASYKVGEYV